MAQIGRVCERTHGGRVRYYLDFSPGLAGRERRLWSDRGHAFQSREHAEAILGQIRGLHARLPLSEAVGEYRRLRARPNLVPEKVALWLDEIESSGDYAPYTLAQYRGYAKAEGHFSFWDGRSVYEIRWGTLREWTMWLRARGLGAKSIRNAMAAFRSFYSWLRRGRETEFPVVEFPSVKAAGRRRAQAMPLEERAAAMGCVPERDRGIFLAMKMGIRPAEARAARVGDYDFRRATLIIAEALKGQGSGAPRGETKTGEAGTYPVSEELRRWIERNVPTTDRFRPDAPLFPNPRTGRPFGAQKLRELWLAACKAAGVDYVPIYRAMKHTSFTALAEAGVPKEDIRALARHRDERTTERYLLEDDVRRGRALSRLGELEQARRRAIDSEKVAALPRTSAE
jgi:integrase